MAQLSNSRIIELVKEITIAKMPEQDTVTNKEYAKQVTEFMQIIYDKLVELNNRGI